MTAPGGRTATTFTSGVVRLPWTTAVPVPEGLRAIANRATAQQHRLRYRGARTLLHALAGWLAALIVGGGLLTLAGIVALVARRQVRAATPPAPTEAMASMKRDVNTVKSARHYAGGTA